MPPSNRSFNQKFQEILSAINPGTAFLVIIFSALIAFEMFNYTTTDHALQDLLGGLQFTGMRWSTILAFAFCGIDFAGIARLFTPEQGMDEPKEVWYLFGAWLLAATMNAILTWWGVSMAITNHLIQSAAVVDPKTIATVVPVFVAVMVWVIRILIIGTLSTALDRTLHSGGLRSNNLRRYPSTQPSLNQHSTASSYSQNAAPLPSASAGLSPRASLNRTAAASSPSEPRQSQYNNNHAQAQTTDSPHGFPEPTYHSLSMKGPSTTNSIGTSSASSAPSRYPSAAVERNTGPAPTRKL